MYDSSTEVAAPSQFEGEADDVFVAALEAREERRLLAAWQHREIRRLVHATTEGD